MRWMWALAAAAVLFAGCEKKQIVVKEKTTRGHTGKLEKRLFQQRIPLQGTVQSVEFATISAKISGTLELLKVDEGDAVTKGKILFGLGFHQYGKCLLLSFVIFNDFGSAFTHHGRVTDAVMTSGMSFKRNNVGINFDKYIRIFAKNIQFSTFLGAV